MKIKTFKIAAIVMAMVMAVSLTACAENNKNNTDDKNGGDQGTSAVADNTSADSVSEDGEGDIPDESDASEENTEDEEGSTPEDETDAEENKDSDNEDAENDNADNADDNNDGNITDGDNSVQNSDTTETLVFSANPTALTTETGKGEAIAKLAAEQAGIMFKYGGASPDIGFDNSGLIYYALTENGISCPRSTSDIAEIGSKIKYDQLQVGDIAFFEYENDGIAHFGGIYVGDGKMAISMSDGIPVKVIDITTDYYRSTFMWGVCVAR